MPDLEKMRHLTKLLFISGTINILLLAFLFYWVIREKPPAPYYELKPAAKQEQQPPLAIDHSNAEVLRTLRQLPLEQLSAKLTDTQLIENGYSQRDLALGCMVTLHHFDLKRALLGLQPPEQERKLVYGRTSAGKMLEIVVYPGLSDAQFQAIVHYANTERWPLTSKGLYFALKRHLIKKETPDPTLVDAFLLTPEFLTIEMLFNRSNNPVDRVALVKLLAEGNWALLTAFAEQQRVAQDLSPARRQKLLLDYIEHGSRAAAYLLLRGENEFAVRKLDDRHVLLLLRLLPEATPEAEQYAISQLTSPRSNAVWKMAAKRLYQYAGELPPANYQHHVALERFVKKKTGVAQTEKKIATVVVPPVRPTAVQIKQKPQNSTYTVQEGDSLWKISRRFKVDLDKLKKANRLTSDRLKPGMTLKIPT